MFRGKLKWYRQNVGFMMLTKISQCKNLKIQVTAWSRPLALFLSKIKEVWVFSLFPSLQKKPSKMASRDHKNKWSWYKIIELSSRDFFFSLVFVNSTSPYSTYKRLTENMVPVFARDCAVAVLSLQLANSFGSFFHKYESSMCPFSRTSLSLSLEGVLSVQVTIWLWSQWGLDFLTLLGK